MIELKHGKTSKLIRNGHKISPLMNLSSIQTLEVLETQKGTTENPRGLYANVAHF
jgi:hypothetical protein